MINLLLVEDDMDLSMGIEYTLKKEGYLIKTAKNIKEARERFNKNVDLILLDVTLPDGSGYDFCKEIRNHSEVPIIFLTACDEEVNVVLGLDIGGDDYITKPVRIRELISRISAVLRRKGNSKDNVTDKIIDGEFIVEPLKCKVYKNSEEIMLTNSEYRLLLMLIENKGKILSRRSILEKLWDIDGNFVEGKTLTVYIRRLREKLGDNGQYIETVRGVGYRWREK